MSVATQLVAPGYDPDIDTEFESGFAPDSTPDSAPGPARRRAHLRAVPVGDPAPSRSTRPVRRVVPAGRPQGGAAGSVAVLLAPEPEAMPVRLTRRGIVVLALLVAALGAALVWVAALSSPSDSASGGAAPAGPAVVTVQSGDTLWSIAGRVAPRVDPRAEVEHLRQLNGLTGASLEPGQQLHVR